MLKWGYIRAGREMHSATCRNRAVFTGLSRPFLMLNEERKRIGLRPPMDLFFFSVELVPYIRWKWRLLYSQA
jgi:hypothetical protein